MFYLESVPSPHLLLPPSSRPPPSVVGWQSYPCKRKGNYKLWKGNHTPGKGIIPLEKKYTPGNGIIPLKINHTPGKGIILLEINEVCFLAPGRVLCLCKAGLQQRSSN